MPARKQTQRHPIIEEIDNRHARVGTIINRLRVTAGYTHQSLADTMGIPRRSLEDKLANRMRFSVGELVFLTQLLGIPLTDLLDMEVDEETNS